MRILKAGIIGLGVGEQHIAGYLSHPQCRVVALCDIAEDKLAITGKKHPGVRLTTLAEDLLQDPEIDVVSIASYDDCHFDQIAVGIRHGKHLFVEKPLCLHESELTHIRLLLAEHPVSRLSSNLILRMSPRFRNLKMRIQQGLMGELFSVEGDYNYGRLHKIHQGWRGQLDYYSVFSGGGVHMVDLLLWLTGDRAVEVTAYGNAISSRGSNFRFNDFVSALIKFKSGMVGKVTANFGCVFPHFHNLIVYGTKATFVNGQKNALLYTSRDVDIEPEIISDPYPGMHKGDLIRSFIDSILSGTEPEVSTQDVLDVMSICLAVEKSLKEARAVSINYL